MAKTRGLHPRIGTSICPPLHFSGAVAHRRAVVFWFDRFRVPAAPFCLRRIAAIALPCHGRLERVRFPSKASCPHTSAEDYFSYKEMDGGSNPSAGILSRSHSSTGESERPLNALSEFESL